MALVRSNITFNSENVLLDEGTLLVTKNRDILGKIRDTLGPVKEPLYSVAVSRHESINLHGIIGMTVYRCPDFTFQLCLSTIQAGKGCDASNVNDEEIPSDEQEFSDDERERLHRRKKKNSYNRENDSTINTEIMAKDNSLHPSPIQNDSTLPNYYFFPSNIRPYEPANISDTHAIVTQDAQNLLLQLKLLNSFNNK